MASRRDQRQQETHFKVIRLLDEDPSISTREIALRVGISNGAAYYCVTALVEKGFVKLKNFTKSKTKTNYIYELTPRGIREHLGLNKPIYAPTAAYGHFGRVAGEAGPGSFSWEATDLVDKLASAAK